MLALHFVTGLYAAQLGEGEPWQTLLLGRSARVRGMVGGQVLSLVDAGQWWRLATSVLLHADGLHVVVNVVSLWGMGRLLEPWVGSVRLIGWFVAGGVAGSLASWIMLLPRSDGASGGIFALLGAALVLGLRHRAALIPEDKRLYGPVLFGFLSLNLVLTWVLPFIDASSHVGGLALGLVAGALPWSEGERHGWALVVGMFLGAVVFGFGQVGG